MATIKSDEDSPLAAEANVFDFNSSSCAAPPKPTSKCVRNCCTNFCSSELRLWTVLQAVLIACIMTFLVGVTLAFSSPALIELTQLQDLQFRFNTGLADLFGVRNHFENLRYLGLLISVHDKLNLSYRVFKTICSQ